MGFRFRRSFRVFPGLKVNLSKSGVSTSIGTRGAWFTIGPRGTRTTVGIPGTGLSYTEQSSAAHGAPRVALFGEIPSTQPVDADRTPADQAPTESEPALSALAIILALAAIIVLVAGAIMIFR
jgi:hypothetical protein